MNGRLGAHFRIPLIFLYSYILKGLPRDSVNFIHMQIKILCIKVLMARTWTEDLLALSEYREKIANEKKTRPGSGLNSEADQRTNLIRHQWKFDKIEILDNTTKHLLTDCAINAETFSNGVTATWNAKWADWTSKETLAGLNTRTGKCCLGNNQSYCRTGGARRRISHSFWCKRVR